MSKKRSDCYIEVWREKNFEGEYLRIYGPVQYRHLKLPGADWGDQIASLRVGPHAFVLAYRDRNFKSAMVAFGPNQTIADLGKLKFDDEIDSIKIINSIKILDHLYTDDEAAVTGERHIESKNPSRPTDGPKRRRKRSSARRRGR
ncbi:MAG: hypothetical protein L0229_25260 [Blastocatellia bacterium]|nr:hypothetical protein [Blastocatellia bacterium]